MTVKRQDKSTPHVRSEEQRLAEAAGVNPTAPPTVTLTFSADTQEKLRENAAQTGRSVEEYIARLVEHATQGGNGTSPGGEPPADLDDQTAEARPWRGVFVLDYPREELFRTEREIAIGQLPALPPEIILDPRRLVDDGE